MRAANSDTEITIEVPVNTPDLVYGASSISWRPLSVLPGSPEIAERFFAEVQDQLPSKAEGGDQGLAQRLKRTRIRMRHRSDITAEMRVTVHRDVDEVYQIIAGPADIGGRKDRIEFMCESYSTDPRGT